MRIGSARASRGDGSAPPELRRAFTDQQRREARDTTLVGGLVALVALPAWSLFDGVLVPDQLRGFVAVRLVSAAVIAVAWAALRWHRVGRRWPELLSLLIVATMEVAIAWMVPRSGDQLEAYLLGLTLPIYATAFLLVWRWVMTAALVGITGASIVVFSLGAHPGWSAKEPTTIAFYLLTASALAVAAQLYREAKQWQQHVTQAALEAERARNAVLVEELEDLSREDPLTSVGNRRAWDERLTGEYLRARRSGRPLSTLVFDLDHFKDVNDRHGHNVGDAVLRSAAALLADQADASHFVARLGGDEFAVLCPDTSLAAAAALAAGIREGTAAATFADGVRMTCSIGVAELEGDDDSTERLFHRADCALYAAKQARDSIRCAEPGQGAPARSGPLRDQL